MTHEQKGYIAGLTGQPSLPPSLDFQPRRDYERGYYLGSKARLEERFEMDND